MRRNARSWFVVVLAGWALDSASAATPQVKLVADQAEAAVAVLAERQRSGTVSAAAWQRLWDSEGFRRLKRREESFGRAGVEAGMREYLLSAEALAAAPSLAAAVAEWKSRDVAAAAATASAYLPAELPLRATLYPVVKRSENSFVFELDSDPAMFLHVDPAAAPERIANTLAHELHHIGTAACPVGAETPAPPTPRSRALRWLGGFGEGIATLAAAGGPDHHPHSASRPQEWLVWQRDLLRAAADFSRLEEFFRGVLAGKWDEAEEQRRFLTLINAEGVPQGPFYTVGWLMAAAVEKRWGRAAVTAAVCEPWRLLARYDELAREQAPSDRSLPLWSPDLLAVLQPDEPPRAGSAPEAGSSIRR